MNQQENKTIGKDTMKSIRVEKLTLNVGAGKDQSKLERGMKLLKNLTGIDPVKTVTHKRIPSWGLRPGLPIGCKITLRKEQADKLFKKFLEAKDGILKESQIDDYGNVSFGIHEYIDIPGIEYDPEVGIMGFQVCLTLSRAGYRVMKRKRGKKKVPLSHRVTKQEAIEFIKKYFNAKIGE